MSSINKKNINDEIRCNFLFSNVLKKIKFFFFGNIVNKKGMIPKIKIDWNFVNMLNVKKHPANIKYFLFKISFFIILNKYNKDK